MRMHVYTKQNELLFPWTYQTRWVNVERSYAWITRYDLRNYRPFFLTGRTSASDKSQFEHDYRISISSIVGDIFRKQRSIRTASAAYSNLYGRELKDLRNKRGELWSRIWPFRHIDRAIAVTIVSIGPWTCFIRIFIVEYRVLMARIYAIF